MADLDGLRQWTRTCNGCGQRNWEGNSYCLGRAVCLCDNCYENRHSLELKIHTSRQNASSSIMHFRAAFKFNYEWRKKEPTLPSKYNPFQAAKGGAYNYVKQLVEEGKIRPNSQSKYSKTLISSAVRSGNIELVKYLIEKGGQVDFPFYNHAAFSATSLDMLKFLAELDGGSTAKWVRGDHRYSNRDVFESWNEYKTAEEVNWMVEHGMRVQRQGIDPDRVGLHLCTTVEAAKALIGHGADVHEVDDSGDTVVSSCSLFNSVPLVEYYISQGVDPCYENKTKPKRRQTALWEAASCYGNLPVVKLLVQKGCDPRSQFKNDSIFEEAALSGDISIFEYLLEQGVPLPTKRIMIQTILNRLAIVGNFAIDILSFLEKHGVDIKLTNNGRTILHLVCAATCPMTVDLLDYLYAKGFDVDKTDASGNTPLLSVRPHDPHAEMKIRWLLTKGVNIHQVNQNHMNMLHILSRLKPRISIPLLNNEFKDVKGITPNQTRRDMPDALFYWAQERNPKGAVLKALLDHFHGYDLNTIDSQHKNLLYLVVGSSETMNEEIQYLLDQGVKVTLPEMDNILKATTDLDLMKILIEHGADPLAAEDGKTPLQTQIKNYSGWVKWESFKYLIDLGADVNTPNSYGEYLLDTAVDSGNVAIVKYLIEEKGVDYKRLNDRGQSHIFRAVEGQHAFVIDYLVKKGLDINATSRDGDAPIHRLGYYLCLASLKQLEQLGVDLKKKDANGKSVLFTIIENCRYTFEDPNKGLDLFRYLVEEKGLNCNERVQRGHSLLQFAAEENSQEIVLYLMGRGLEFDKDMDQLLVKTADAGFAEAVKELIRKGADTSPKDGTTLLHRAIDSANRNYYDANEVELVRYLVEEKIVDINALDSRGNTPLLRAINTHETRDSRIIKYLISHGADVTHVNQDQETALFGAVEEGIDLVRMVVEAGCPLNHVNESDRSAWFPAVKHKDTAVLQYLIAKGCDITLSSGFSRTNALWELWNSNEHDHLIIPALEEYVKQGYDLSKEISTQGQNLLRMAVINNQVKVVEYLVQHKVDPHYVEKSGDNILGAWCSSSQGRLKLLKYFVGELGVNVNHKNKQNESVLCKAIKAKNLIAVQYLHENGAKIEDHDKLLRAAIVSGDVSIVAWLFDHGVSPKPAPEKSFTVSYLALAAREGHLKIVKLLVEMGAQNDGIANIITESLSADYHNSLKILQIIIPLVNPDLLNQKSTWGSRPLGSIRLAANGSSEVVKLLVESGADVNAPCNLSSETILHRAVAGAEVSLVECLLSKGADKGAKVSSLSSSSSASIDRILQDGAKRTAYSWALSRSRPLLELLSFLRSDESAPPPEKQSEPARTDDDDDDDFLDLFK